MTSLPKPSELLTKLSEAEGVLTVISANQSMQLSKIKKEHGDAVALVLLMKLIKNTLMFVKHKPEQWNDEVIGASAQMMLGTFWMFKIDEFILAFRNGINGKYGIIYANIAYTDFTMWLSKYSAEAEHVMSGNKGLDAPQLPAPEKIIEEYRSLYAKYQNDLANKDFIKLEKEVADASELMKYMNIEQVRNFKERVKDTAQEAVKNAIDLRISELTQLTID